MLRDYMKKSKETNCSGNTLSLRKVLAGIGIRPGCWSRVLDRSERRANIFDISSRKGVVISKPRMKFLTLKRGIALQRWFPVYAAALSLVSVTGAAHAEYISSRICNVGKEPIYYIWARQVVFMPGDPGQTWVKGFFHLDPGACRQTDHDYTADNRYSPANLSVQFFTILKQDNDGVLGIVAKPVYQHTYTLKGGGLVSSRQYWFCVPTDTGNPINLDYQGQDCPKGTRHQPFTLRLRSVNTHEMTGNITLNVRPEPDDTLIPWDAETTAAAKLLPPMEGEAQEDKAAQIVNEAALAAFAKFLGLNNLTKRDPADDTRHTLPGRQDLSPDSVPLHRSTPGPIGIRYAPKYVEQGSEYYVQMQILREKGQKVVDCSYGPSRDDGTGFSIYTFWLDNVNPNMVDSLLKDPDHPFRQLGTSAISECPKTMSAAMQLQREILQ